MADDDYARDDYETRPKERVTYFKAFVGGLSFDTRDDDLKAAFREFGPVRAEVIKDAQGRAKGFGFVYFTSEQPCLDAIDKLDGMTLDGRRVTVNKAIERDRNAPRDHDRDRYRGNRDRDYDSRAGGYRDGGSGPRRDGRPPTQGFRLTLKNLPPSYTWRELKDFLRTEGNVTYADVKDNGEGVGEYHLFEEAERAVVRLNGKELDGYTISAKPLNFDMDSGRKLDPADDYRGRSSDAPRSGGGSYRSGGYDDGYDRGYKSGAGGGSYAPSRGYDGGGGAAGSGAYRSQGGSRGDGYTDRSAERGYDKAGDRGYSDRAGYDRGYDRPVDKAYDRGGYDRSYDRGGYDRGGYERAGYERGGYSKGAPYSDRGGSYERGYDRSGERGGYDRAPAYNGDGGGQSSSRAHYDDDYRGGGGGYDYERGGRDYGSGGYGPSAGGSRGAPDRGYSAPARAAPYDRPRGGY